MEWTTDPLQLIKPSELMVVWPSKNMTNAEKLNASTRFIIYASVLIYFTRKDPRIFAIGLISIFVLIFCFKREATATYIVQKETLTEEPKEKCRQPTKDNPAGNRLLGPGYLDSAPLCDEPGKINAMISQKQVMEPQQLMFGGQFDRQFYSTPLAMQDWATGQGNFAEFLGEPLPPNKDFCKNNPKKCIASWTGRPGGAGGSSGASS